MKRALIALIVVLSLTSVAAAAKSGPAEVNARIEITATDEGMAFIDYSVDISPAPGTTVDVITFELANSHFRLNDAGGYYGTATSASVSGKTITFRLPRVYQPGETAHLTFQVWQSKIGRISGADLEYKLVPIRLKDYNFTSLEIVWVTNSATAYSNNNATDGVNKLTWLRQDVPAGQKVIIKVVYPDMAYAANQANLRLRKELFITYVIVCWLAGIFVCFKFAIPLVCRTFGVRLRFSLREMRVWVEQIEPID